MSRAWDQDDRESRGFGLILVAMPAEKLGAVAPAAAPAALPLRFAYLRLDIKVPDWDDRSPWNPSS